MAMSQEVYRSRRKAHQLKDPLHNLRFLIEDLEEAGPSRADIEQVRHLLEVLKNGAMQYSEFFRFVTEQYIQNAPSEAHRTLALKTITEIARIHFREKRWVQDLLIHLLTDRPGDSRKWSLAKRLLKQALKAFS